MESQGNNSKLKGVIIVLVLLLVSSILYIVKLTADSKTLESTIVTTKSEKDSVMKDLAALKATYDTAIAENTSMSDQLIAEREKIVNLMEELKKSKGDNASLLKYKSQYKQLEQKMKNMMGS